jgi:lipopolysaccharide biosynthesis glycosyltransferase
MCRLINSIRPASKANVGPLGSLSGKVVHVQYRMDAKGNPNMASVIEPICVVTAADDNYSLPLAATVRSALDSAAWNDRIELYVIDGGISVASREKLQASWNDRRLKIHWITPDLSILDGMGASGHVTRMTYARLLVPRLLPNTLDRVIYLDSDLLVRRKLRHLWQEPVDDVACRACQDPAAPWLDSKRMLPNYSTCSSRLASPRPIPNFHELKLDGSAAYFNAGVLVINLRYWREHSIAERAIECLHVNRDQVLWWDQYALNVVLHRRWRPLDIRWNQGAHIFRYETASLSPFDGRTYARLCRQPWIVHFSSHLKPWHRGDNHPYRLEFFRALDRTAWRCWRPAGDFPTLAEQAGEVYRNYRGWYKQHIRPAEHRLKELVGLRKRAA